MNTFSFIILCFSILVAVLANPQGSKEGKATRPPTRRPEHRCPRARNQDYDCQFVNVVHRGDHPIYFVHNPGKKIAFSKSQISYLPKSFFDAFPEMETASLENMKMHYIENKAFENAGKLQNLNVRKNYLREFKKNTFEGAQSIKKLNANDNEIASIDPDALNILPNLRQLNIAENKLEQLPKLSNNKELLRVGAFTNQINRIENDQFINNQKIQEIILKDNQITHFDLRQLNNKRDLAKVDVSYNRLTILFIPNNIKVLSAKNNSIASITHQGQSNIEELDLSNNALVEVPQLTANELRMLDLSNNRIIKLDFKVFSQMPKLTHLNVSSNYLFELKMNPKPISITELDLSNNKLNSAPSDCKSLANVRKLYLNNNDLVQFCGFDSLKKLKHISLSGNNWDCLKINLPSGVSLIDADNPQTCKTGASLNAQNICCKRS
ncbi:nephrocan-like [Uranotaenia lowii]|uniref:nephrocan-like n=1 Tax=Uranotaenia lowii TaxID=190385 RepID=UPI00247A709C|nr:nephrocan-like [Uranotaenia lowii]